MFTHASPSFHIASTATTTQRQFCNDFSSTSSSLARLKRTTKKTRAKTSSKMRSRRGVLAIRDTTEDICGIDLGTTNSAVAIVTESGAIEIVPVVMNAQTGETRRTMPSVIHFASTGEVLTGHDAVPFLRSDPKNTFSSVKRLIGRKYRKAKEEMKSVPYECCFNDKTKRVGIKVPNLGNDVSLLPEEISSKVIERLVLEAERYRGLERGTIEKAVITVPAYFDQTQVDATIDAGITAGLKVVKTLREPVAAALAYGVDIMNPNADETIFVFDLGGGTFDVSILEVGGGTVEVLATGGDSRLGGDDLDVAVAKWMSKECDKKGLIVDFRGALLNARKTREKLSDVDVVNVPLPPDGKEVAFTRQMLEKVCTSVLRRMRQPCVECADSAGVNLERLRQIEEAKNKKKNRSKISTRSAGRPFDRVLLVGGATKTPCVRKFVENTFSRKPELDLVDPDEVVAVGAAVRAGSLSGTIGTVDTFNPLEAGLIRAFAVAKGLHNSEPGGAVDDLEDGDGEDDEFDEAYLEEDEGEWEDDEIPDDLDDLRDMMGP
jgi:heat shock protein 1/8